ncbi:MAG TPA: 3-hydroxyacyl-ACP dehydratase [Puia sp.]|nr:3-hydroxyacyl-ACP dehydratase [Puia sp.]
MLLNDFFTITGLQREGDSIRASLKLNASHKIFEGHFPGLPVVPGACMMQMLKEIVEAASGMGLQLKRADHLKFTALIDPRNVGSLDMECTLSAAADANWLVSAQLSNDGKICFKFKGLFIFR